ncbi:MAG: ATP-binding protein [Spirochaetaceae bacterium]|nr:ATP-binding protein [Spirochaetaceae bacterium]
MSKTRSLRVYLFGAFLSAVLLPYLVLGVVGFSAVKTIAGRQGEEKLDIIVHSLAGRAMAFLEENATALRAAGQSLDSGAVEAAKLPVFLGRLLENYPVFETIMVLDGKGLVEAISPEDPDFVGIDFSRQEFYRGTRERFEVAFSDTFLSLRTGHSVVSLTARAGSRSVVGILDLEKLSSFLVGVTLGKEGSASIVDSVGTVIADRDRELVLQRSIFRFPGLLEKAATGELVSGVYAAEGKPHRATALRMPFTGWTVALYQPLAEANALSTAMLTGFIGAMTLAIAVFVAILLLARRRILLPLERLSAEAARISAGDYSGQGGPEAAVSDMDFTEIEALKRAFAETRMAVGAREAAMLAAEDRLRESLTQKDVLLREIHHRVKNNLQIISSILSLQADALRGDPAEASFLECQGRVQAMAAVHERLYQSEDLSRVSVREYFETLLDAAFMQGAELAPGARRELAVDDSTLDLDRAVPCGLIVAEALSNSMKHAFPNGREGTISVRFARVGGRFELSVRDDGAGPGSGFTERRPSSLGLHLIDALSRQLRAEARVGAAEGGGFEVSLAFAATVGE